MFPVGRKVFHKTGKHSGTVTELDGDTVYLMQDNGVEIEFPASELTASPPSGAGAGAGSVRHAGAPTTGAAPTNLSRMLSMKDIADEHRTVLAIIPPRTIQAVAALYERRPGAGRFSALDVAQKINFIADVTEVPYRTMKEFSDQPGTLSLMMGRGLAARRGSGGLVGGGGSWRAGQGWWNGLAMHRVGVRRRPSCISSD